MNNVKKTADFLGLKIGEQFEIVGREGRTYKITHTGLQWHWPDGVNTKWKHERRDVFLDIIFGAREIKRISWKPKDGEHFYIPYRYKGMSDCLELVWRNEPKYEDFYNSGTVFKTKEEAIAKAESNASLK